MGRLFALGPRRTKIVNDCWTGFDIRYKFRGVCHWRCGKVDNFWLGRRLFKIEAKLLGSVVVVIIASLLYSYFLFDGNRPSQLV